MFEKRRVTTDQERSESNKRIGLVIGILLVFGSSLYIISYWPFSDLSAVQVEYTSTVENCNTGGKHPVPGYKYAYEFKAGIDTFYGTGFKCYEMSKPKSDIGEKVWIVYNKHNPNFNSPMKSLLYAALALIIGLGLTIYIVRNKLKQRAELNRYIETGERS